MFQTHAGLGIEVGGLPPVANFHPAVVVDRDLLGGKLLSAARSELVPGHVPAQLPGRRQADVLGRDFRKSCYNFYLLLSFDSVVGFIWSTNLK